MLLIVKCLLNLKKSKQCLATPLVFPFSIIWKCSSESIFPGFMGNRFPWIHCELDQDAVYCFVCCKAVKEGKIRLTEMTEASCLVKGFINWKNATRGLYKHDNSDLHKAAASALSTKANVANMLSVFCEL